MCTTTPRPPQSPIGVGAGIGGTGADPHLVGGLAESKGTANLAPRQRRHGPSLPAAENFKLLNEQHLDGRFTAAVAGRLSPVHRLLRTQVDNHPTMTTLPDTPRASTSSLNS